jgi:hypothetical protein
MEIMSPLPEDDWESRFLGQLIYHLAFELRWPKLSRGSTTFRRRDKAKGLEPDECFYFRDERKMRGKKRVNLKKDPPPELVVEVDITSRSVPREPIYAALGVPEIRRLHARHIEYLHFAGGGYKLRKMSLAFPFLEPAVLWHFVEIAEREGETQALEQIVAWIRDNAGPEKT